MRVSVLPEDLKLILDLVACGIITADVGYITLLGGRSGLTSVTERPSPRPLPEPDDEDYIPPYYDEVWQEWDTKH
jgi:hypothetical protein